MRSENRHSTCSRESWTFRRAHLARTSSSSWNLSLVGTGYEFGIGHKQQFGWVLSQPAEQMSDVLTTVRTA